METHKRDAEIYHFIAEHFDMLGKQGLHLSGLFFTTGGLKGCAVIDAGYNIGYVARQLSGTDTPDAETLEAVYAKVLEPFEQYDPVGHESHWEEDSFHANGYVVLVDHKELIMRIARELWGLFPEIHRRYGVAHPETAPAEFYREHTTSSAFQRIELSR